MPLQDFKLEVGDTFDLVIKDVQVKFADSGGNLTVDCTSVGLAGVTKVVRGSDPKLTAGNIKRAEKFPEHWPPRVDDVWSTDAGILYHCIESTLGDLLMISSKSIAQHYSPLQLKNTTNGSLKLVYRAGNQLRKTIY